LKMSPDEGYSAFTPLNSSGGSSFTSMIRDTTVNKMTTSVGLSHSNSSSRSVRPDGFAPDLKSSPQKRSNILRTQSNQRSMRDTALPLSPPSSLDGSSPSSSARSVEEDLSAEFIHISNGLAGIKREVILAEKRASLECRDRSLIQGYGRLVDRLKKEKHVEKKRPPLFHVEDSNFQIESSSGSSSERLHPVASSIENPRDTHFGTRGAASDLLFSPPPPVSTLISSGDVRSTVAEKDIIDRRTEGTQATSGRVQVEMRSMGTNVDLPDEITMKEKKAKKKERVQIVEDYSTESSPERDRVLIRRERSTVERRAQPRQDHLFPSQSFRDCDRVGVMDGMTSLSHSLPLPLPSAISMPFIIQLDRLDYPKERARSVSRERLESRPIVVRERSEERKREIPSVKGEKNYRIAMMKREKEKKAANLFPPVIDIDQLRGRKKCPDATKKTLGSVGVKEAIGDERRREMRRGKSVGVEGINNGNGKKDEKIVKKVAFVSSSHVDGVSHSLAANRQTLLGVIKCNLPSLHGIIREYLNEAAMKERDIVSGLRKYLKNQWTKEQKELEVKLNEYDGLDDGDKKASSLAGEISRLDAILSEINYLVRELGHVITPSTSSSIVNQLRSIHSHLLKCPPLRSED
ncbi:hypothetical protein PFISCL1PPCAC_19728, partial [Pristionchus fissidentatus]